jgi:hypothetical protein
MPLFKALDFTGAKTIVCALWFARRWNKQVSQMLSRRGSAASVRCRTTRLIWLALTKTTLKIFTRIVDVFSSSSKAIGR